MPKPVEAQSHHEELKGVLQNIAAKFEEHSADLTAQIDRLNAIGDQSRDRIDSLKESLDRLLGSVTSTPDTVTELLEARDNSAFLERIQEAIENLAESLESQIEEAFKQKLKKIFESEKTRLLEVATGVEGVFQSSVRRSEDILRENAQSALGSLHDRVAAELASSSQIMVDAISHQLMSEITETVTLASAQTALSQALAPYAPQIRAAKELAEGIAEMRGG